MKRRGWSHAWEKTRTEGECRACSSTQIVDPAHLVPRSRVTEGGEDPRNIIPLCRLCHMAFDQGTGLDVLPYLTLEEQSYVVGLVGIAEAFRRTTGVREAAA
jgi:predicted restriction endonuclease